MSGTRPISELHRDFQKIASLPDIRTDEKIREFQKFSLSLNGDVRKGALQIRKQCEGAVEKILAEQKRVTAMMQYEREYREDFPLIAGVDEVGRGPFAGPIVTAAVILPPEWILPGLNDSKKVPERKREELSAEILKHAVGVSFGENSPKAIDEMGIARADTDAMRKAVLGLSPQPDLVLTDAFPIDGLPMKQIPIIKGDAKSVSIAAASIVAKVKRDRYMLEMNREYPGYHFERNKGYGTADHIEALKQLGPCPIHRRTFIHGYI